MGGVSSVTTAVLHGVDAEEVTVEVSTSGGIPGIDVVGMPDSAVLESRSRVRCALRSCGFELPREHVTVNLKPGDRRKTGTGLDLPIAVAILVATGQLHPRVADGSLLVGELGLKGEVCPVRGAVAYALLAEKSDLMLVTSAGAELPGALGASAKGMDCLYQAREPLADLPPLSRRCREEGDEEGGRRLDFSDVADQELAKRAMTIAAAGRHGLLMVGPPGAGKTMLARRLPTILPPLGEEERARSMLVHSVAGQPVDAIARGERPFRAPHHSISIGGLVGGGRPVLPGEVSLAHNGVLFLDELPEFGHGALQSLRQPLEDHEVHIVRVDGAYTFPCDFQLVAAANPCPCGHLGDVGHDCACSPARIAAYQARVGGPLMDRIDVVVDVARPATSKVIRKQSGTGSDEMREAVEGAREFRAWRDARSKADGGDPVAAARLDARAEAVFEGMAERLALGGRAIVRVARVARTIADLAEHELVDEEDLVEAMAFRSRTME